MKENVSCSKEETLIITDFEIGYDGIYSIRFMYNGEQKEHYVCIPPSVFMKMFQIEGYSDMESIDNCDWIPFKHIAVKLGVFMSDDNELEGWLTSECAEGLQSMGLCLLNIDYPDRVEERNDKQCQEL